MGILQQTRAKFWADVFLLKLDKNYSFNPPAAAAVADLALKEFDARFPAAACSNAVFDPLSGTFKYYTAGPQDGTAMPSHIPPQTT